MKLFEIAPEDDEYRVTGRLSDEMKVPNEGYVVFIGRHNEYVKTSLHSSNWARTHKGARVFLSLEEAQDFIGSHKHREFLRLEPKKVSLILKGTKLRANKLL